MMTELLNVSEKVSVKRLAIVTNDMLEGKKIPDSWRMSDLISIYKGKDNVRSCESYQNIKLLEHGIKVIKRICEKRLRKVVKLEEMQMGFMPKRGTIDAIFVIRQILKKYEAAGRN